MRNVISWERQTCIKFHVSFCVWCVCTKYRIVRVRRREVQDLGIGRTHCRQFSVEFITQCLFIKFYRTLEIGGGSNYDQLLRVFTMRELAVRSNQHLLFQSTNYSNYQLVPSFVPPGIICCAVTEVEQHQAPTLIITTGAQCRVALLLQLSPQQQHLMAMEEERSILLLGCCALSQQPWSYKRGL